MKEKEARYSSFLTLLLNLGRPHSAFLIYLVGNALDYVLSKFSI